MDLKKTLFTIFAIFCVLGSACAICAADDFNGGYSGSNYWDMNCISASNCCDNMGDCSSNNLNCNNITNCTNCTNSTNNATKPIIDPDYAHMEPAAGEPAGDAPARPIIDPDYAHMEPAARNATHAAGEPAIGNATHAAGEPTNATGSTNHTNVGATSAHSLPATGNPILALFAACALLGGYTALRKK